MKFTLDCNPSEPIFFGLSARLPCELSAACLRVHKILPFNRVDLRNIYIASHEGKMRERAFMDKAKLRAVSAKSIKISAKRGYFLRSPKI